MALYVGVGPNIVDDILEFYAANLGNTGAGFLSQLPTGAIGGTNATNHYLITKPMRIVGILIKLGTSTIPSDRTFTIQKNGVDTALATTLTTGFTGGSVLTPTVDVVANDQVSVRHNTASASPQVVDMRFYLLMKSAA